MCQVQFVSKTMVEDATQIMSKLQTMNPEESVQVGGRTNLQCHQTA